MRALTIYNCVIFILLTARRFRSAGCSVAGILLKFVLLALTLPAGNFAAVCSSSYDQSLTKIVVFVVGISWSNWRLSIETSKR